MLKRRGELIPAIDLLDGRVVRLVEGGYDRVTGFPGDPLEAALGFAAAGADWLHVVDLDGARDGRAERRHAAVLERLVQRSGLRVQSGGGIRTEQQAARLLDGGVARVLLGSLAAADPELAGRIAAAHPGGVAAAVDVLAGRARVAGWTRDGGIEAAHLVQRLVASGVSDVMVTAIDRDGTGAGPDLDLIGSMRPLVPGVLIAAGGVAGSDDAVSALAAGADGMVIGRALHDGSLDLAEAIGAVAAAGPGPRPVSNTRRG